MNQARRGIGSAKTGHIFDLTVRRADILQLASLRSQ
jgi:hypothetical protein